MAKIHYRVLIVSTVQKYKEHYYNNNNNVNNK